MTTLTRSTAHRTALALTGVAMLTLPGSALAEEPATWSMTPEELQEIGLGQSRGMPVPVPADAPRLRAPTEPKAHAAPGTIFVNFDGAQLSSGFDDATSNVTQISNLAGSFAPYGEGSKREAVMQALLTDWSAYDVRITDERPASGEYTMNMTGPTNPFGGGVLGIAPLDCNDAQTHSNITFAFHSANDQFSAAVQATTVSQEVAHSYGLEHVDEPGDIMNPYNAGGDASFIDACIPIVTNGQGIACGSQHAVHCSGGTAQNAHLELLDQFGAAVPDTAAPTVFISYPLDGEVFEPGSDFTITVEASDDVAVETVQLFNNGTGLQSDGDAPYEWDVERIPEGDYALSVVARDAAGNETTSETVTITVAGLDGGGTDGGSSGGTGGGGEDGGGPGGGDGTGGSEPEDTDGAATVGLEEDGADSGCGCTQSSSPGSWLLILGLFGLLRRRETQSAP